MSWGSNPSDLDSMVDVIDSNGNRINTLYYHRKTLSNTRNSKTYMTLDVDETEVLILELSDSILVKL